MSGPSLTRHYSKIPELRPRTEGDVSSAGASSRFLARSLIEDETAEAPREPKLVSTAHGRISRMLLTIPAYAVEDGLDGATNPIGEAYRDLLAKLGADVTLEVLTHRSVESTVRSWLQAAGRTDFHIATAPDHLSFSVWAEDGYAVVQSGGGQSSTFVEPFYFPRYADSLVADLVSDQTDLGDTQAPLYFQGGNILIGDDFFLIGADYPANSLQYINKVIRPEPGEDPKRTVQRLYREYLDSSRALHYVGSSVSVPEQRKRKFTHDGEDWEEVLYFGNKVGTVQPLFHIDMFITLAGREADGRYRLLVGDPEMAAQALGEELQPHAMQGVFDSVAANLERIGFSVHRNPLPLTYVDEPAERARYWYFATANNALVEIPGDEAQKRVWLPTYGHGAWTHLAKTDEENRKLWASLGFEVIMLGDFHSFASNLGAVHCVKKYLARGL
jgi:hypothetical protein